ncbi:YcjF family protein [Bizionia sp.]|uniref:YcjF family protein n=1 Tax=Bizionia sp. TaxID=1954480 RepID=UPI003A915D01
MSIAKSASEIIAKAKEKLKKEVSDIENRTDLTDQQKVDQIVKVFSTFCAAIAVQPIPFADIFVLTPIQGYMGKKIADIRGFPLSEAKATEIFKELAGLVGLGFLAQQLAIGAYKTVLPFLGALTTIPLVFGLTFGMGRVMDYYFVKKSKGEKIDKEALQKIFKQARQEGKQKAKENKEEINKKKNEL